MTFLAYSALLISTPALEPIQLGSLLCHPRRLMVKLDSNTDSNELRLRGWNVIREFPEIGTVVVETPVGKLQTSRNRLQLEEGVLRAEFDRAARPAYTPNDPEWPNMWHMTAIKADLAWDRTFGSSNVTVAVIDTGVMVTHPDLAANIWVNSDEIAGNNIDDDANGYVDDINGYDFAYSDADPNDVYGHGTACAGLVAAVQDNNIGGTGVAPRAKIMALKASIDSGYFYDSNNVGAYLYAANNGAKVLSMSFYSDRVSAAEGDAIRYCWTNGVVPVAAAGNDSTIFPYYPAAYDETLSVAAVGTGLNKAGFSNYGTWVDVAAPGVSLTTTTNSGGYTGGFSGTSGACPHVAGLAALLFGARLNATAQEVRNAIEDSATTVNQAPFGEYANYGLINCQAAVNAILDAPAPPKPPVVRYVSTFGFQPNDMMYWEDTFLLSQIHGRGFNAANTLELTIRGFNQPIENHDRDNVNFEFIPPKYGPFVLKMNGNTLTTLTMPPAWQACHPLTEASTPGGGASVTGGFIQALNEDGVNLVCTRRNDGNILLHGTFRKVVPAGKVLLTLKRRYTGKGTESIKIYNWNSASYPYGGFTTLHTGPAPTTAQTIVLEIPNPNAHIDFEQTMYLQIEGADMANGSQLQLDFANVSLGNP